MILHRAGILAWLAWDASGFFEWLANRPWYSQILQEWGGTFPLEPGNQGLEVGCGPGLLCAEIQSQGVTMTGLDKSPGMIKRARSSVPQCSFIEGDALSIPLPDSDLDLAFAASVVNIVSEPQKLISEMARVVRTGGHVSVLFPTPRLTIDAAKIAKKQRIRGLSAEALATWASKANKREPKEIQSLFTVQGLSDASIKTFFHGCIASVSATVN